MSHTLSQDLRDRFKGLMDKGQCAAAAGRLLTVSRATAARWGKKVRDGTSLVPLPVGCRPGKGKLAPYIEFFTELIVQDADITLAELSAALYAAEAIRCNPASVHKALKKHGYTYKKRPDRSRAREIKDGQSAA